jgi:hypothetical protein
VHKQDYEEKFANCKNFGYTCQRQVTNDVLRHFRAYSLKLIRLKNIVYLPLSQGHGVTKQ